MFDNIWVGEVLLTNQLQVCLLKLFLFSPQMACYCSLLSWDHWEEILGFIAPSIFCTFVASVNLSRYDMIENLKMEIDPTTAALHYSANVGVHKLSSML